MSVLRFPNPAADLGRIIETYTQLYDATKGEEEFTLDDAIKVMVMGGQASSSGAVGAQAIQRSTRDDRSRDPLFNQLKMYSELHRMLGWYHPGERKSAFSHTLLGEYVAEDDIRDPKTQGLVRECFLGIVHPNPNVESRTANRVRYFPLLLDFLDRLGGHATMNEIVIGVHTIPDDQREGALEDRVAVIKSLRSTREGGVKRMREAFAALAAEEGKGTDTIGNYTRIPLGVVKSKIVNWATPVRMKGPYDRSITFYQLTDDGLEQLREFKEGLDVRPSDLDGMSLDDRAFLANYGFYGMLDRAGYEVEDDVALLVRALPDFPSADALVGDRSPERVYYSPYQEAAHEDLERAVALYGEIVDDS